MSSKTREALLKADVLISIATFEEGVKMDEVDKIRSEIKSALAEPLRNCDVGTAEEQAARFYDFCDGYHHATGYKGCGTCPLWVSGTVGHDCELRWSQMPYEEVK